MAIRYEDLKVGDWVLFDQVSESSGFCPFMAEGIPMMVRGLSLPWIVLMPVDHPGALVRTRVHDVQLTRPSPEYVAAYLDVFRPHWDEFVNQRGHRPVHKEVNSES